MCSGDRGTAQKKSEPLSGIQEVVGSIPIGSTSTIRDLSHTEEPAEEPVSAPCLQIQ
jgi:hypothetical protein